MATIRARRTKNGLIRYTAEVRRRQGKKILYQETRTFSHRGAAEKWAKSREVALESPEALVRAQHGEKSLRELIRWYIKDFAEVSKWQRTKQSQLEFLERHPMSACNVFTLNTAMLIDHVRTRRASGAGPATVGNDLTWIGVVLRTAKSVKQLPVRPEVVEEARTACRALRLIAKSKKRERRPTGAEIERLSEYFARRDRRAEIPMHDIFWFAIHTARREAEICRLTWKDNDANAFTGWVRDAKHPTNKEGNHRQFKYTKEAWEIIERQPRTSEYVFPCNAKSVGSAFTRACKMLNIVDLRFHDLRHEATSRLFERGYQIHEVAQFTLHESWNELKRYTNLRPANVRQLRAPVADIREARRRTAKHHSEPTSVSIADDQSTQPDQSHSRATGTSDRQP